MWLRGAFIALLMVVMVTGSGIAEFATPSLDQWGDGVERVFPQQQHLAAGRHGNAVWVAPSSIVVVSGAPVALHTLPSTTITTVAAGEEMVLRSPYARLPDVYQAHYTRPADSYQVYYAPTAPAREVYTIDATSAAATAAILPATYVGASEIPVATEVELRTNVAAPSPATLSADAVHVIQEGTYVGYTETTITRSVIIR